MLYTIRIRSIEGLEKNSEIIVHKDFITNILEMLENSADVSLYQVWAAGGRFENYFLFGFVNIPSKWAINSKDWIYVLDKSS